MFLILGVVPITKHWEVIQKHQKFKIDPQESGSEMFWLSGDSLEILVESFCKCLHICMIFQWKYTGAAQLQRNGSAPAAQTGRTCKTQALFTQRESFASRSRENPIF